MPRLPEKPMTRCDDLQAVNHALRELVRLQLADELEADVAWRERRQMLEAVEQSWDVLDEDVSAVSPAGMSEAPGAPLASGWRERLSQAVSWRLSLSALLLLCALATFFYVSSL